MTYKTPLILVATAATFFSYQQVKSGQVLSPTIEITPTIPVTVTVTVIPKPTRIPTPTPKPQPVFTSEQIYNFTEEFGKKYDVDPNVIRYIALCESTFKPGAKNYIYAGLFQFDSRTWKTYRQLMGENPDPDLRFNAKDAVQTASFAIFKSGTRLWPNCKP